MKLLAFCLLYVSLCADSFIVVMKNTEVGPASDQASLRLPNQPDQLLDIGHYKGYIADLTDDELSQLQGNPKVQFIEKNETVKAAATQLNAPYNLARLSKRFLPLRTPYYYREPAGKGVDVYVIDSGIQVTHQEFEGRASMGASFTGDGLEDKYGHGTHVAGIVAGKTFGVAKQARVIGVKVLNNNGSGDWGSVIAGINWVIANHKKTGRKSVVNLSIEGPVSMAANAAVEALHNAGIPVIVAAGNDGGDACQFSPASAYSAITVAASDKWDKKLQQPASNDGSCVNVIAPGYVVLSAYIGSDSSLAYMSGTSMAAPHVAGMIAIFMSRINIPMQYMKLYLDWRSTKDIMLGFSDSTPNRMLYGL